MVKLKLWLGLLLLISLASSAVAEPTPPAVYKPVVAGLFYPAEKKVLEQTVDGFLKEGASGAEKGALKIFGLMAPHAGYEYSGKVAGTAYSRIAGGPYKTVIILGPSHYAAFPGVSIYPSGSWETPLGRIPVDEHVAAAVMAECKFVRYQPAAFEREHSLEVQIPFLQKALANFKIVPMVMGQMAPDEYGILSRTLASLIEKSPGSLLIVASSDMSHYHPYAEASRMDRLALKEIEALDLPGLGRQMANGTAELCGAQAVATLMLVAERLNGTAKVLRYANSGDVTKDQARVVGYGAVAFSLPGESMSLTRQERTELLEIAKRTLKQYVAGKGAPPAGTKSKRLNEKGAAFVTLNKHGELRGCIGTIRPVLPLAEAVSKMTVSACSEDPRFPPVSPEELKSIDIEISVLSPMKPVRNVSEIQVGKHGLYTIRGDRSGLLLPQVATQYGWDREEFLKQTCNKAGLPAGAWKEKDTQLYLFLAEVFGE